MYLANIYFIWILIYFGDKEDYIKKTVLFITSFGKVLNTKGSVIEWA